MIYAPTFNLDRALHGDSQWEHSPNPRQMADSEGERPVMAVLGGSD